MGELKGTSYITNVAGFKDTNYSRGGGGTLISGNSDQAKFQKQLLKTTRSIEEKFDLMLYAQSTKHNLGEYSEKVKRMYPAMTNVHYRNPLTLLYAAYITNSSYKFDSNSKEKLNKLFSEEEGKENKIRAKNGVRDVDIIRYALYFQKMMG